MTDNEIIKALECCGILDTQCTSCPYYEKICCVDADALDLINRQKAEIEALQFSVQQLSGFLSSAKAEAIKEFAERVKNECESGWLEIEESVFDNLVKEMTEGNDEKSL